MAMTHKRAIEYVVAYMHKQKWCYLAVDEIAGTRVSFPEKEPAHISPSGHWTRAHQDWTDRRRTWLGTPAAGGGVLDVLALSEPASSRPRIAIVEVKVTLADLLRDLRADKMRRYEPQASHVYLALGPGVFPGLEEKDLLRGLHHNGLPRFWGVITLGKRGKCRLARLPGKYPDAIEVTEKRLTHRIVRSARSMAYRRQDDHMHIRILTRAVR